jgi:hypothetical protein
MLPVLYDAVAIEGRGCALVANQAIPAGTTVLQEDPVLVYTTHAARAAVCASCLRFTSACCSATHASSRASSCRASSAWRSTPLT